MNILILIAHMTPSTYGVIIYMIVINAVPVIAMNA